MRETERERERENKQRLGVFMCVHLLHKHIHEHYHADSPRYSRWSSRLKGYAEAQSPRTEQRPASEGFDLKDLHILSFCFGRIACPIRLSGLGCS